VLFGSGRERRSDSDAFGTGKIRTEFFSRRISICATNILNARNTRKSFDQGEGWQRVWAHDEKGLAAIQASKERLKNGRRRAPCWKGGSPIKSQEFRLGNAESYRRGTDLRVARQKIKRPWNIWKKAYQRHEYELITIGLWKGFLTACVRSPEFQDLMHRLGHRERRAKHENIREVIYLMTHAQIF